VWYIWDYPKPTPRFVSFGVHLRKSDISRKVQVIAFFVNNERNFCRKLSFCSGRVKNSSPVSAAWENRSIVTTLIVNSCNHFDRSFWSGDIFMLTMWLCSAGKSYCNGIRKGLSQKWTTLRQNVYTRWASRERWKNLSGGFNSISWWRFFHWLFPRKLSIDRT